MGVKIVLADDHRMMRAGLRLLLQKQPDMEVVGDAADGQEAVRLAAKLTPNIVIMDVSMPGLNGIEATRQIKRRNDAIKVVALSGYSDEKFVTEMLKAGASGYILKDSAFADLITCIQTVMKGETYLSPSITGRIVAEYLQHSQTPDTSAFTMLTDKEREVLQLIAEGKTTKEIAGMLGRSVKTMEVHRNNIMSKLNLRSVAELTKYAIRAGLTSLES
jgi:DNA-binding NarL/FixJ family response regulator